MGKNTKKHHSTTANKVDETPVRTIVNYTNCKIPAELFFNILNTEDYTLLGTGDSKELEEAFYVIFDEYVDISGNNKIKQWYAKRKKVALLQFLINYVQEVMKAIITMPLTTDERLRLIEVLNEIPRVRAKLNVDKPILEEVKRIQTQVLGILRNELNMELSTEQKQGDSVKHSFHQDLARISANLGFQIKDDVTLYEFEEYKKIAINNSKPKK